MSTYKKPLRRSIAVGCVLFTAILCLALGLLNYRTQRDALYLRYRSQITDILHYVDSYIDDQDLMRCIETGEESETYRETLRIMDRIMNEFSIHYLYAIKPLNLNERGNVMSVLCAERDYDRYVDTAENLYLGWISDDEYDPETVKDLFAAMEQEEITFFVERTGWSTDYTGALPLRGPDGEAYAILAVDVDVTTLDAELWSQVLRNAALILLLGALYTVAFLSWTKANVTRPIALLEKGVVDFVGRSHGQRSLEALKFDTPDIRTDNEVESLSKAIAQMTEDMRDYVSDVLAAEEKTRHMKKLADTMSELATMDSLTGIRNKAAYSHEAEKLGRALAADPALAFGLAMIDLNYLKVINDTYGHEKGDEALKALTRIVCTVFAHSPVFRVGGDEFAVILRGRDLQNIGALVETFQSQVANALEEEPWKHVSAAIGVALFDPAVDAGVEDVLKRADQAMYQRKKEMKALRDDPGSGGRE